MLKVWSMKQQQQKDAQAEGQGQKKKKVTAAQLRVQKGMISISVEHVDNSLTAATRSQ